GVADLSQKTLTAAGGLLDAVWKRIGETAPRHRAVGSRENGISRHAVALSAPGRRARAVVLFRRIEDSITASHHEFVGIPGETGSRPELGFTGIALMRCRAVDAREDEAAFKLHADLVADRVTYTQIEADCKPVFLLLQPFLVLVAQAKIESQRGADA